MEVLGLDGKGDVVVSCSKSPESDFYEQGDLFIGASVFLFRGGIMLIWF